MHRPLDDDPPPAGAPPEPDPAASEGPVVGARAAPPPGPGRALAEVAYFVGALLGTQWLDGALAAAGWPDDRALLVTGALAAVLAVLGLVLVRPLALARGGRPLGALGAGAAILAVTAFTVLGRPVAGPEGAAAAAVLLHTLVADAGLIGVALLLLARDGQDPAVIGFARRGALRELPYGLAAFAILLVAHLAFSILVAVVTLSRGGLSSTEIASRTGAAELFTSNLAVTAATVVVGVVAEEILFRGFILVRLHGVFGRWAPAVALGAVLFGLGHVYEGPIAAVQAAWLGVVLSGIFLWRRHLLPGILAHAAFNAAALAAMLVLTRLGVL